MASTYSSLKIQLMATGENSGTWGTVTNTNLGTAIEEAIVGSSDVTFNNADVTLTLTDTNASQSARNLRLNLTGTVASPQSLIVPAIEKVYIINNGLSQTITVKNSTGTGIAVPAGKTLYVYNNGTNVVDAITHLTSLTLASPLPVASGGTGSATATFSGANITSLNANNISSGVLAVAQGGTGSNTGTFSGANITSLNASNISSGTLAVARGGTGINSAGTAGNVLTSNGTAWVSQAAAAFDSGTSLLFVQTSAPTGWTKSTAHNNKALRVVSGTASSGGSVGFTTAFASQTPAGTVSVTVGAGTLAVGAGTLAVGSTTLTTAQMPSHNHTVSGLGGAGVTSSSIAFAGASGTYSATSSSTGGGGSHNHGISGSPTLSGAPSVTAASFLGAAINLAVAYVDTIIAVKD